MTQPSPATMKMKNAIEKTLAWIDTRKFDQPGMPVLSLKEALDAFEAEQKQSPLISSANQIVAGENKWPVKPDGWLMIEDHCEDGEWSGYASSQDPKGNLNWEENAIPIKVLSKESPHIAPPKTEDWVNELREFHRLHQQFSNGEKMNRERHAELVTKWGPIDVTGTLLAYIDKLERSLSLTGGFDSTKPAKYWRDAYEELHAKWHRDYCEMIEQKNAQIHQLTQELARLKAGREWKLWRRIGDVSWLTILPDYDTSQLGADCETVNVREILPPNHANVTDDHVDMSGIDTEGMDDFSGREAEK